MERALGGDVRNIKNDAIQTVISQLSTPQGYVSSDSEGGWCRGPERLPI